MLLWVLARVHCLMAMQSFGQGAVVMSPAIWGLCRCILFLFECVCVGGLELAGKMSLAAWP